MKYSQKATKHSALNWFVIGQTETVDRIQSPTDGNATRRRQSRLFDVASFVLVQFAIGPIDVAIALLALPIYFSCGSTKAFTLVARRSYSRTFLKANAEFNRRICLSVVSIVATALLLIVQSSFFSYSVYRVSIPTFSMATATGIEIAGPSTSPIWAKARTTSRFTSPPSTDWPTP